jgi:ribosomal-protein-alanine N-acetyltransferase
VVRGPERVKTNRLLLRRPVADDAVAVFARYSGDPAVTTYLGWPRHESVADARAFLAFSDEEWRTWPAGPYLIESRADGRLLGSTGFSFEATAVAATGYVLAQDAWGLGYATEALSVVVTLVSTLSVHQLYGLCHPDNPASARVLKKCGFALESTLPRHAVFPNLGLSEPQDCLRYSRQFA